MKRRDARSKPLYRQADWTKQVAESLAKAKQDKEIILAARGVERAELRKRMAHDRLVRFKGSLSTYREVSEAFDYAVEYVGLQLDRLVSIVQGIDAARGRMRSGLRRESSKSK